MRVVVWALLAFGSVAVLVIPRFLPFYDYPEWVLQGRIVHDLWTGATNGGIATSQLYGLVAAPVPNLAAPVGIALLSFLLPIEAAGRAFLVIGVLGFGFGFGYLVRCYQRRPTIVEFTGFLWVFGYFLERGYVSYLFGLPIAFVAIGLVHRQATRPGRRVRLVVLVVLQVLAFLAHLVAWAVLVLATVCYAVDLYRRGRRAEALCLLSTVAPAGILLVWYTVAAREVGHFALFANVREKLLSLAEAVLLFPRLDPYSGSVPSFPAQLLVVGAFLGIAAWGVHYRSAVAALRTPAGITAMILAAVALLDPVGNVNSLTKPDQRLLFPALLLVLAALPWKALRPSTAAAGVGLVAAGLVLHGVAFVSMDAPLQQAYCRHRRRHPGRRRGRHRRDSGGRRVSGGGGPVDRHPGAQVVRRASDVGPRRGAGRPAGDFGHCAPLRAGRKSRAHHAQHGRDGSGGSARRDAGHLRRGLRLPGRPGPGEGDARRAVHRDPLRRGSRRSPPLAVTARRRPVQTGWRLRTLSAVTPATMATSRTRVIGPVPRSRPPRPGGTAIQSANDAPSGRVNT